MRKYIISICCILLLSLTVLAGNVLADNKEDSELERTQKAAEQGDTKAQYNVGLMYYIGQGVPRDEAKAVQWFQKAAVQGRAEAQYSLGVMYAEGRGVPRDEAKAAQWFQRAAVQGHANAQNRLDRINTNRQGAPQPAKQHTNSIGMEFVLIPAGSFIKETGINKPSISNMPYSHVEYDDMLAPSFFSKGILSSPFYLGKYPVTQEQWVAVMGSNPSEFKALNNPVENVSWNDTQEFIKRLNAKEGINQYRLPTEMEWEYAARGGVEAPYFFLTNPLTTKEEEIALLAGYVWFEKNSNRTTHPVGQKKPNQYGLYDIYGNVQEWVQDWKSDLPKLPEIKDYRGPAYEVMTRWDADGHGSNGRGRVLRGGSYRTSFRLHDWVDWSTDAVNGKSNTYGFRLVFTVTELTENVPIIREQTPDMSVVQKAVKEGIAEAQYDLGMAYANGRDVPRDEAKAAQWFQKAAEQRHPKAHYSLSMMAEQGYAEAQYRFALCHFRPRNEAKILHWLQKAAEQGHVDAQYKLGLVLFERISREGQKAGAKVAYWYQKAAEQGHAAAQCDLGMMYLTGRGITQDEAKAAYWFQKATAQGNANAQYILGVMHFKGQGVPQDEAKAVQLIKKAAEQGQTGARDSLCTMAGQEQTGKRDSLSTMTSQGRTEAQYSLAMLYANGQGGPKNEAKAMELLQKAAKQGHVEAQYNLGLSYFTRRGLPQGEAMAAQWYQNAADQGHTAAQNDLGKLYLTGRGVKKDEAKAAHLFQKAAEKGDADAQYNLGVIYSNGQGVSKDDAKAAHWFQKAAEQGIILAQYNLGVSYGEGCGVPKDESKAAHWYQKAAEKGDASAQNNLGSM
jgi:TPR repeat protein